MQRARGWQWAGSLPRGCVRRGPLASSVRARIRPVAQRRQQACDAPNPRAAAYPQFQGWTWPIAPGWLADVPVAVPLCNRGASEPRKHAQSAAAAAAGAHLLLLQLQLQLLRLVQRRLRSLDVRLLRRQRRALQPAVRICFDGDCRIVVVLRSRHVGLDLRGVGRQSRRGGTAAQSGGCSRPERAAPLSRAAGVAGVPASAVRKWWAAARVGRARRQRAVNPWRVVGTRLRGRGARNVRNAQRTQSHTQSRCPARPRKPRAARAALGTGHTPRKPRKRSPAASPPAQRRRWPPPSSRTDGSSRAKPRSTRVGASVQ